MLDLAVNDARIVDGTGRPARRGSVGVRDGKVVEVASADLTARRVIDAAGKVVCPGFIDLHSHADFAAESQSSAETQLAQGVTTLVTGNCGQSPFPVGDLGALQSSTSFLRPDLSWSWTGLTGFREAVTAARPGVNLALQVGHGALRTAAMGAQDAPADEAALATMRQLLQDAAAEGAVGFSTGLIYAPGSYATSDEVDALAATAAECGLTYSTHVRNETDSVLDAVDEAIGTARRTGVSLEISHIKAMGVRNHGKVEQILRRIDRAVDDGVDVMADVYPYVASSTTLTSRLPLWAMDGGAKALLSRLSDPRQRAQVRDGLAARFDGEIDPAGIVLADLPDGPYTADVGRSIVDIAERDGAEPAEAVLAILDGHNASVAIVNHAMAEADLEMALQHPLVSVASDGWVLAGSGTGMPHPRSFGSFARVLGRYSRERGVLTLEEAIRKMTSQPAARMRLADRGAIRVGAVADLVVLDPETVTDRSTYEDPWQLAIGVSHVLIAGQRAYAGGTLVDTRAGVVL